MEFSPQVRVRPRVFSAVGSRIVDVFQGKYNTSGVLELVKTGEKNIYEEIQSHKDSVDLQHLIVRAMNGEPEVLSRRQGVFCDMTNAPSNLAEMLNYVNMGRQEFESLPLDVRQKFGCDFAKYAATIGTPDWLAAMTPPSPAPDPTPAIPVNPVPVAQPDPVAKEV